MDVKLVIPAQDIVGESAVWDDERGLLAWVDIIGQRIHRLDPQTGMHEVWPTPGLVTSIGLRKDGGAIVGLQHKVALFDWGLAFETLCDVEPDGSGNRLNEGVVAPDGSFWIGTMQNNIGADHAPVTLTKAAGRLYRVTAAGEVTALTEDRFWITNTMVWPTADQFVTADTMENKLYSYKISNAVLTDRRLFQGGYERGVPDGSCMDVDGYIWTARVAGGACLTRTAPDGEIVDVVELPCSWPTSCVFGGPDMQTLFVTSARFTMSDEHLKANPQEGAVFQIRAGVRGRKSNRFG